jgi:serine protease inhibitor
MSLNLRAGLIQVCLIFLFALTLPACHKDAGAAISKPLDLPANSPQVISAENTFAINIFRTMQQSDPEGSNTLISPLSIYTALSMAYNGAAGATRDSMTQTLALAGVPLDLLNSVSKALIEQMPHEDNKVQLSIANSLWYDKSRATPNAGFIDIVGRDYQAVIQSLDFSKPSSISTINSWVSQHTNNKIPAIINGLNADDLMVLINAIYFNGSWKYAFKASDTHNDIFYRADGSTASLPFMTQTATFRSYHNQAFTMIGLPYGTGSAFEMYALLPGDPHQSLNSFVTSLDNNILNTAITQMDSDRLTISLPKWEYSYAIPDLIGPLSRLGMGLTFHPGADLTNMYPPSAGAYISKVIHKTYIKVNEAGTEAAAATGAVVTGLTSAPPNYHVVKLDHPFVYLITEKQTGAILFMGKLNDPGKN